MKGRSIAEYVAPLIRADAKSYIDAVDFVQRNSTFFTPKLERGPYAPASPTAPEVPMPALHTAAAALTLVPPSHWDIETHKFNINSYDGSGSVVLPKTESDSQAPPATDKIFKKELYNYLRWALSASAPGPGIPETMAILGRDETLRRVQDAKASTQAFGPSDGRRIPKGKLPEDQSWMGTLATKR